MFAIPGKQAVSITAAACTQISKLMRSKGHSGPNHLRRCTHFRAEFACHGSHEHP